MKLSEFLFLGLLAVFAGATLYGSLDMPYGSEQTFGAGFVPLNMSVAVLVLGALIVFRGVRAGRADIPDPAEASGTPKGDQATSPLKGVGIVIATVALIAATIAAAHFGSLMLPLGLSMVVITALFLERGWRIGLISTAVALIVIYGIFDLWLKIPLS
ncbi:MAG: tripartite tricarboxylate transporter TctB family protein [Geminicoccaceae bacterium]|nr:tripartite tricarboxylate transporter TctB family protein [Geminicoccaceae bacterium]MCB9942595.1 tripartite tricarboxylate transporter TctB family protein [Geminicoccaceae bacterium]